MPDYRRAYVPGGTYFFTVVTFDHRPFLTSELARQCLRSAWTDVRKQHPFRMPAVCILPDHLHCIWTLPPDDADFSGRCRTRPGWCAKAHSTAWKRARSALPRKQR